jgi:chaperonin GroES
MKDGRPFSWDRIVVKRIRERTIGLGGAVIPAVDKDILRQGEVVAVKRGMRLEHGAPAPLNVKVGDRVVFGNYSGAERKRCGTGFLIIRADDVLGFIDPEVGRDRHWPTISDAQASQWSKEAFP